MPLKLKAGRGRKPLCFPFTVRARIGIVVLADGPLNFPVDLALLTVANINRHT